MRLFPKLLKLCLQTFKNIFLLFWPSLLKILKLSQHVLIVEVLDAVVEEADRLSILFFLTYFLFCVIKVNYIRQVLPRHSIIFLQLSCNLDVQVLVILMHKLEQILHTFDLSCINEIPVVHIFSDVILFHSYLSLYLSLSLLIGIENRVSLHEWLIIWKLFHF